MHWPSPARWIPLALWLALTPVHAQQEKPPPDEAVPVPSAPVLDAVDSTTPRPLAPIPDDPPPHEGAMIDLEYIIEPPDMLLVEVLEALPGRPISGERLVRPDGAIHLGFYGKVHVRGLTLEQAKVKVIFHLRKYLTDDVLGLWSIEEPAEPPPGPARPIPPLPGDSDLPLDNREKKPSRSSYLRKPASTRVAARNARHAPIRRVAQATAAGVQNGASVDAQSDADKKSEPVVGLPPPAPPAPADLEFMLRPLQPPRPRLSTPSAENKVIVAPGQNVKITIEIQAQGASGHEAVEEILLPTESPSDPSQPRLVAVPPEHSDRVFVDVTSYNSKVYYVEGDVAAPGRMPWTGQETVLDAMNYAGGFLPTANPKDVRLVRPPRAGKPARVYAVDYEAILKRGEPRTNYQLFPGDRLVIGRNDVVAKTIEIDRLAMPLQTIFHSLNQLSVMAGSLKYLGNPAANPAVITASQRDAVVKAWAEFWARAMAQPGGVSFDEKVLRDVLMRALNPPAEAATEKK